MTTAEQDSGLRIVSLGGGTGLSWLLSGLKTYVGNQPAPNEEASQPWVESLVDDIVEAIRGSVSHKPSGQRID